MTYNIPQFIKKPYNLAIAIMMIWVVVLNFEYSPWNKNKVIEWDVISYYAYLPATFIYNDISLEFTLDDEEYFKERIWPVTTPTGNLVIITSMGMAFMYSPFFFVAHIFSLISPYEADGYSAPYSFALVFSSFFFVLMGLIVLKKILLRWFTPWVTTFTIVAVFIGTNLLYYTTYEAAMSHGYNFALISLFLYLTIRWYDNPGSVKRIAILGLLAGLITLVRPTNILVLILFFLWGVGNWHDFRKRILFFFGRPALVAVMAACFILVWVPQFLYWKHVAGVYFYFSYGEAGGTFFWNNPQVLNILFSYKKGWFVYTPLMLVAFTGIFFLPWKIKGALIPILVFKLLNIYVLSSWWSWWFGGGFGLRAFVDSYAVMAIPFATIITFIASRRKWLSYPVLGLFAVLIWFSFFQMRQYRTGAIHHWWMNKEAYWETFLKRRPTDRYWELIYLPDYKLARQGIYVGIRLNRPQPRTPVKDYATHEFLHDFIIREIGEDSIYIRRLSQESFQTPDQQQAWLESEALKILQDPEKAHAYAKEKRIREIEQELRDDPEKRAFVEAKALEREIHIDTMFRMDATWIYESKKK